MWRFSVDLTPKRRRVSEIMMVGVDLMVVERGPIDVFGQRKRTSDKRCVVGPLDTVGFSVTQSWDKFSKDTEGCSESHFRCQEDTGGLDWCTLGLRGEKGGTREDEFLSWGLLLSPRWKVRIHQSPVPKWSCSRRDTVGNRKEPGETGGQNSSSCVEYSQYPLPGQRWPEGEEEQVRWDRCNHSDRKSLCGRE